MTEQQRQTVRRTADRIRHQVIGLLVSVIVVLGIAVAALAWAAYRDHQATDTAQRAELVDHKAIAELNVVVARQGKIEAAVQSPNHAKDIYLWCDAINQQRTYDRSFVQQVTQGHVAYNLSNLPCATYAKQESNASK